ncbi:MAG: YebC/PmpR family DNA-binding transcriptional regulator [Christensenellales bacterium]
MSGHSKWSNIKRKKERSDAQKGKIFTKIGRELAVAVRGGGSDPAVNSRLADVISKAKAANMPNDTIWRSIKRAAGEGQDVIYEEIVYEGYAPGGVAVIVEALTDNRNRTASDVRHAFDKFGGSLGATGCVSWMFDRKGVFTVEQKEGADSDDVMMMALEAGADDVIMMSVDAGDEDFDAGGEVYEIICDPGDFSSVRTALEDQGFAFISAQVERVPQSTVAVSDPGQAESIRRMLDMLEDSDDVQTVFHNGELPDDEE